MTTNNPNRPFAPDEKALVQRIADRCGISFDLADDLHCHLIEEHDEYVEASDEDKLERAVSTHSPVLTYEPQLQKLVREYVEDTVSAEDPNPSMTLKDRLLDLAMYIVARVEQDECQL